jgi:uncharacterized membrane protein
MGADEYVNAGHIKFILEEGVLPLGNPNVSIGYSDFPGFHILASSVCQIAEIGVFQARSLLLPLYILLLAAMLYLLYARSLKNAYAGAFAALLLIGGSLGLATRIIFYPTILGLVFLVSSLMLLSKYQREPFGTARDKLILILFFLALTLTHFATALYFIFVLLAIYLMQKVGKMSLVNFSIILLFGTVFMAWEIYGAIGTFSHLAEFPLKFLDDLSEGHFGAFEYFSVLAGANVGEGFPIWANITRIFWWLAIFVFGLVLALKNLFAMQKLDLAGKRDTYALIGVAILSGVLILITPSGGQFYRYLVYAGFFAVPIIIGFFLRFRPRRRKIILGCAATLFLLLSVPTFLAHHNTISTSAIYPHECAAGEFLQSTAYVQSEDMTTFSGAGTASVLEYYVPNAHLHFDPSWVMSEDEFHEGLDSLVTGFEKQQDPSGIFVFSKKLTLRYEHLFGITADDPAWTELREMVSHENEFYDNGYVQMYRHK